MSIPLFFAMSGEDMQKNPDISTNTAWMSCHFSPCGSGLTDLPTHLPPNGMLILDDRIPMDRHDPDLIRTQLLRTVEKLKCSYLLLELQRKDTRIPVEAIVKSCSCPVGVTPHYAESPDCAVFLPPVPPHIPLPEYIAGWKGRRLWLEMALDGVDITVTPQGSTIAPVPFPEPQSPAHRDKALCCHYTLTAQPELARFSLYRTRDDIKLLLTQAEQAHIQLAIGLYRELAPER